MHTTDLYFECHITIYPPSAKERWDLLDQLSMPFGFKVATFVMKKDDQDSPDAFLSARGVQYDGLKIRTENVLRMLQDHKYLVKRVKIENTLLDTKFEGDKYLLLDFKNRDNLIHGVLNLG